MPSSEHAVVLQSGQHLTEQAVSSPNGEYTLVHRYDGNVVVYRTTDAKTIWATDSKYQDSPDLRMTVGNEVGSRPGRLLLRENGETRGAHG